MDEASLAVNAAILRVIPALVVDLETSTIIAATPRAEELFGYIPGELTKKDVNILVPEDLQTIHKENIKQFNTNPHARTMGQGDQILMGVTRQGELIAVEIGLEPIVISERRCVVATIVKRRT